ncbi:MAG: mechanosensitive ion channel family protein [Myxococcaceae bacterium]
MRRPSLLRWTHPAVRLALTALLAVALPAGAFNAGLGEPPAELDRSSPFATVEGFLAEAHRSEFGLAAHDFWLDDVPKEQQAAEGALVARRLRLLLERHPVDLSTLSKEGESGPSSVVLAVLDVDGQPVPLRLVRVHSGDSVAWLFGRDTVRALAALDASYDPPFGKRIPRFLFESSGGLELWQWLGLLLALVAGVGLGFLCETLLLAGMGRLTRLTHTGWDQELVLALHGPLKVLLGMGAFQAVVSRLLLPPRWESGLGVVCQTLGILAASWFGLRALDVAEAAIDRRLNARGTAASAGARTQMALLWRLLDAVVYLLALAAFLMQFNVVRTVGVSLLASAGVAGIVLGLAAQKSLGAVFAGIQLSVTQPIRIGDLVLVEGEQGTVVKISLTQVVLRIWDNRHLIVPVSYFLEKPFQNWTRDGLDMLGVVLLQVDYRADVDALRAELDRVLAGPGKALWNGRLAQLQVIDSSAQTATVRIVVSSAINSVFDLRCIIREEFLKFLRDHASWLPTQRLEHRPGS